MLGTNFCMKIFFFALIEDGNILVLIFIFMMVMPEEWCLREM